MPEPAPRLYLIAPPLVSEDAHARLAEALSAGDIACVLFPDAVPAKVGLTTLVRLVQTHGSAALLGDAALVAGTDADGVHVTAGPSLPETVRRMKPSRIVGVGGLTGRDDAMTAGEQDVDYLMFGETTDDAEPLPFAERLDRVSWWAEIFRVPCVAVAYGLDEIAPLIEAGAEFVAVGDLVWMDPRGPAAALGEVMEALRLGHAAYLAQRAEAV